MIQKTIGDKIFNTLNILLMLFIAVVTIYPFLNVIAISFNEGTDTMMNSGLIIPRKFTLENYFVALTYPNIKSALVISVSRTVIGTLIHMAVVTLAAYALSKKELLFRNIIITFFLLPTFINPGLIPYFINIYKLGLLNNFLVYLLPFAFSFFDFLIIRTYIQGLPLELEESAVIDGAGYWKIFRIIIVPLAMPSIAAITLFQAVFHWNDWFSSMVYMQTNDRLYTLQYLLQQILNEAESLNRVVSENDFYEQSMGLRKTSTEVSIRMAVLMVTVTPIIVVYPFLQRYFVQGMTLGAVKG